MRTKILTSFAAITLMATSALAHTADCSITVNGKTQTVQKKVLTAKEGESTSNVGGPAKMGNYICYGSISLFQDTKTTSYRVYTGDDSTHEVFAQTTGDAGLTDGATDITLDTRSKDGDRIICSCEINK